jgi:peptidoglycan/xylan/chitin deacetylase (PgdA/CDA1 family)
VSILCYHSVEPDWPSPMAVEPKAFAAHCAWLSGHRRVVPLPDAVDRLDRSGRLPRGLTALTFDDGFAALHEHALPLLARFRLPATVFLVAQTLAPGGRPVDWVDTPPAHPLRTLTGEQVLEMAAAGVDFQSHSSAHLDLTTLSYDECVRDLRESRELLEELLGHPVRQLAYPRGRHNSVVREAAARAGYTAAFALPERDEEAGPFAIPRVGVHRGNSAALVRVKGARSYQRLRTGPAYRVAREALRGGRRTVARVAR